MHTYLIRIDLLHGEREADFLELAAILYAFRAYQVIYNRVGGVWLDLPPGHFILSDTEMGIGKCSQIMDKTLRKLVSSHGRYRPEDIPTYYTLLVSEVAKTTDGRPLLLGNLHTTVETGRLPPGERL